MTTPGSPSALCDCTDPPQQAAVILYPALGTPLLLTPNQKKCSIFIATSSLGVANGRGERPTLDGKSRVVPMDGDEQQCAAATVARHLRLVGMTGAKPSTDTTVGGLTGDGKGCAKAKKAIKVWRVATFEPGAIVYNQKGEVFATISPQATSAYANAGFAGGSVYEVELDLAQLAVRPESGAFKSFAWMVKPTPQQKKDYPTLCQADTVHAQDLLVEAFLAQQTQDPRWRHLSANSNAPRRGKEVGLKEYDVSETAKGAQRLVAGTQRLAAWHPVIKLRSGQALKLGHLSDVHINVRHNALAKSPAKVIEDGQFDQPPVGRRVCNSFNALKELFDKVGADKGTALLLTGDLIDFNRNIDPGQVGSGIGDQWKKFNVLNNLNGTAGLYPRGQDDMLAFSLVRYAYNELKMPVFMTSGNHEAYQVPYGISPRLGGWGIQLGVLEMGADRQATRERFEQNARRSWPDGVLPPEAHRAQKRLAAPDEVERHRQKLDDASRWAGKKANGGIAADHNMTIYEATLAYGPTYGHVWTGVNYNVRNYDWFYALFTPLEDAVIALGVEPDRDGPAAQVLTLLGWGQGENFMNLADLAAPGGVDQQGTGILPRATQSISSAQFALLAQSQVYKQANPAAPWAAASHFTLINYDGPKAFNDQQAVFSPANGPAGVQVGAGLSGYNTGTCERGLRAYFDHFVKGTEGAAANGGRSAIDHHFSGHSHRSALYRARVTRARAAGGQAARVDIAVTQATDPGFAEDCKVPVNAGTSFIVSSCGGPIGIQNLAQELEGWTLRPPSGSLVDPAGGTLKQVATARRDLGAGLPKAEKPRLCVALDYLHIDGKAPLRFEEGARYAAQRLGGLLGTRGAFAEPVTVSLSKTLSALQCIEGVRVWVFEGAGDGGGRGSRAAKTWHILAPTLSLKDGTGSLSFSIADQAKLAACMKPGMEAGRERNAEGFEVHHCAAQAFCEVILKKPTVARGLPNWVKDDELDWSDPWVFPLNIGVLRIPAGAAGAYHLRDFMERPAGELGEVPDWMFLFKYYESRGYIDKDEAIKGKKQ